MHSNIYQISTMPIDKEDWLTPSYFHDNSQDFADYIGDAYDGEERKECINSLGDLFDGVFTMDGESLIYNGSDKFVEDWCKEIQRRAASITPQTIFENVNLFRLKKLTDTTHIDISSRFYIEEWNGCSGAADDLIGFCHYKLNVGDRLYVGAVIDYHF